jgi:hypothetical protein
MFPISLAKTNYLIGVGEKVNVKIETINDDSAKLAKIKWSLDNNGIVSYTVVSKKEIQIQGAASGNCVFSISYDNTIIEKVYVSVKNNTAFDSNAKIITESIIGIVRGQNKETRITSNLASYEIEQLVWESENQGKVRVEPISGDNSRAILKGVANGETYITVKLGAIKRYILVYVCETDAAVGAYRAMNIDNQYYQLKRQEELTLSVYYAAIKPSASTVWEDIYDNNVIEITPLGGKAQIKGINEGIATLKISNSDCLTPIYITIEVSNALEGKVESNLDLWYLSISKTIYVLNPDKQSETVSVAVNPVGFTEDEVLKIKWEKTEGPSLVQIYPSGRQCTVAPGTGEGTAIIRISHPKSNNYLEIKVIMSRDGIVEESMPYIRLDDDIIRVPINGEIQTGIYIENLENQNIALFTASSNNANANVTLTGNVLTVKGKNFGQALITINHPSCRYPKNIVVIVTTTEDGVIYLTTDDNFSIIKKNDYKAIEVALVGFEEKNNTRYHWEADTPEDAALVSISSTGPKAVITGLNIGTARIKVTHEYCQYPLYIYVRISELVDNNPVYITTSNNIVSVKKGNSMQIKSELVNGMMAEYSLFQWSTSNRNIIELNYSGDQALIRGLEVGTAGITIAHPSSMNSITIIVIVEKDETESGIYITTDTQLVEMKPTDASRHINVRLVGGTAEDIYGFKWEIVDYISVIKNKDGTSKPVVALVANADSAYVMPTTNEGEATIRVSHPKTSYRLEFKVLVQLTSKIKFEKTNLIMDMLTSQSVSIEAPTGMTVIYESSDDKIASVMGTDKVCIIEGIKAGTVVITARNTSGTTSDEVVVKVNAVDTTVVEYIYTNTNILTLNTNMSSVSVSAKLVKATTPDDELPDTQYLVYTSTDTNVVSLYGSGPSVSVTPIGAGTAEIQIRYSNSADPNYLQHPTMKNYVKRIYVKVDVDEMIFSISDPLVLLTEGEQAIVTVKVDNVSDIDYDTDIVWASSDTEVATVGKISTVDKGTAQIVGLKAGISTITATYKGSIRRCTVQVSAPRVFAISTTYLDIAPGQTIPSSFDSTPIKITLQPETERFTYSVDSYNFIDVNVSSDSNGALVQITGKEAEGVTVITFTSGTMRCSLTVNNIRNYYLRWINKSNIREDPYVEDNILEAGRVESYKGSRWYVISYEINPRTDTLSLLGSGSPSLVTVEIDNAAKKVYLKPKASGYTILNFYAQQSNVSIELPVYFFYERIEPKWIWSESATYRGYIDKSKTLHSQVDTVQNAIWISDQEYVRIYLDMSYLNTTYPNHGLTISSLSGETIEKIYSGNSGNANLTKDTITAVPYVTSNYFEIRNMLVSKYGYLQEQLSSVDYYGYIKVHYTYFNGGTTKSQFTKNYIIYSEFWRRK